MKMLTFFRDMVRLLFSPPPPQMDFFLQLIDSASDLNIDTHTFFREYVRSIVLSDDDPKESINRFLVKTITLNKDTSPSQHEYLALEILDIKDSKPRTYPIFLEQLPSSVRHYSEDKSCSYFSNHTDSHRVREVISCILARSSTMPGTVSLTDGSTSTNNPYDDIPLLPRSFSEAPPPVLPKGSLTRVINAASLASVHSIHQSSIVVSRQYRASDQFLLGQNARASHSLGRVIRQLMPHGLTLYELIRLAKVVHDEDPVYSLLSRQCYWYANTIVEVVKKEFDCEVTRAKTVMMGHSPFRSPQTTICLVIKQENGWDCGLVRCQRRSLRL
jgi:hypothetical protein